MPETLLIHYSPGQPLSYLLLNEKKAIVQPVKQAQVEDLKALSQGRRLHLLFDSAWLNIESVNIPGNNRQRQLQAVPFALEDKLASDVDELHFALGKKQADGSLPVIAIDKAVLEACLQPFQQQDISLEKVYADVLSLPYTENGFSLLISEQGALIRTSAVSGLYCDRINLQDILPSLLAEYPNTKQLNILHHKAHSEVEDEFANLGLEINSRSYNECPLEIFVADYDNPDQINLLQGAYAVKRKTSALWKHWKSAAALAGLWLLLQLFSATIETRQLEEKNLQLTAQIEKAFKKANPGARKFNNMRKRIERRLKALQNGDSNGKGETFLPLLADIAPVLGQQKKLQIQAMVYRNKHIDMELSADSLQTLEAFKAQLGSRPGIKIVLSTSVEKDKVTGRLRVEKQG